MTQNDPTTKTVSEHDEDPLFEVSSNLIGDSSFDSLFESWRSKSVFWLSRRERSKRELEEWLKAKECPSDIYTQLVEDLSDAKYVDDERMAGMLVRDLVRKKKGPRVIEAALTTRKIKLPEGVRLEDFWKGEQSLKEEQKQQASELLERKYGRQKGSLAENLRLKSKAWSFLMRRGFEKDAIDEAMREFFK